MEDKGIFYERQRNSEWGQNNIINDVILENIDSRLRGNDNLVGIADYNFRANALESMLLFRLRLLDYRLLRSLDLNYLVIPGLLRHLCLLTLLQRER